MKEPVPPGWDPETWYRHLQNLEWLKAMDLHTSLTDPVRNVERFKQRVVKEFAENAKAARVNIEDLPPGSIVEREILQKIETVDLSNADVVILRSTSSNIEGVDQLVVAQLAKTIREKYEKDSMVLVLRPEESLEAFSKDEEVKALKAQIHNLKLALAAHHEDGKCRCEELEVLP